MQRLEPTRRSGPFLSEEWHAPVLVFFGLLFAWNLLGAWYSLNRGLGRLPSSFDVQAAHFRIFFGTLSYALTALGLGISRSRHNRGSVAGYGMVAVAAMLVGVIVLFTTFGVRTIA